MYVAFRDRDLTKSSRANPSWDSQFATRVPVRYHSQNQLSRDLITNQRSIASDLHVDFGSALNPPCYNFISLQRFLNDAAGLDVLESRNVPPQSLTRLALLDDRTDATGLVRWPSRTQQLASNGETRNWEQYDTDPPSGEPDVTFRGVLNKVEFHIRLKKNVRISVRLNNVSTTLMLGGRLLTSIGHEACYSVGWDFYCICPVIKATAVP